MAFGSDDVPPSYVDFASEMLAEIPLEVVADYYPAIGELDEFGALEIVEHGTDRRRRRRERHDHSD